jgi:haloacetate dehalogenase
MLGGFEERRVRVGDAEIYLRMGGEGPPLLLLHGYPQTHLAWHRIAPVLGKHFTLVMPDLRGYGRSTGPPADPEHRNYSKRVMAADMIELMSMLGFQRFRLAGHDRGARVGYRLCLDYPSRVERFAALDIIPTLDVWQEMDAEKALGTYHWQFLAVPAPVPEHLIGADPTFYIEHLLTRWAGRRDALHPRAVEDYIAQFNNPTVLTATCEDYRAGATVDRADDYADLAARRRMACPVLIIWGRGYLGNKASSPLAVWRRWADNVEELALDCGHFIAEEEPEACGTALLQFFS